MKLKCQVPAPPPPHSTPAANAAPDLPQLVNTKAAAKILGRSSATLKRWRYEGVGPEYMVMQGRVRYDVAVLREFIKQNTRVPSVRASWEETRGAL